MSKRITTFIIIVSIAIGGIHACSSEPRYAYLESSTTGVGDQFTFDAISIVEVINGGKVDQSLFDFGYPDETLPIREYIFWSQNDFINVAKTFNQVWMEQPGEDWKILELYYKVWCKHIKSNKNNHTQEQNWGLFSISFYTTAIYPESQVPYRIENNVIIKPQIDYIFYAQTFYDPKPFTAEIELPPWGELNIEGLMISVEEAFAIAQDAGGAEFLNESDKNEGCNVVLRNNAIDDFGGWYVRYSPGRHFLKFVVNDQTGEIQELVEDD